MKHLTLGKKPNLALERVKNKCNVLLKLADELTLYGERSITQMELTKLLGNQTKPLGKWLRLGLIRSGSYSQGVHGYSYEPNVEFIEKLRADLRAKPEPILETAKRTGRLFEPVKREDTKRTHCRHYPWWSYMASDRLEALFVAQFGQMFKYDIEVAQPTIVLQLFDRCKPKQDVPTWRFLVEDRTTFRSILARDLGITYDEVKDVLKGVTNGAYASTSPRNPICKLLGPILAHRLMNHELYIGLREDYKAIRSTLYPKQPAKGLKQRMYFTYERIEDDIMTHISKILEVDAWFIHDGFITRTQISKADLEQDIKNKFNFTIKLEEKSHSAQRGELH